MKTSTDNYQIHANGTDMGIFTAETEAAALDAYAHAAGYHDLANLLARVEGSTREELTVTAIDQPPTERTIIAVLSVDADGETAVARVRVTVPSYRLIASCEGDADGAVDMGIAHGLHFDADLIDLLDVGEREVFDGGYIERLEAGWALCRFAGTTTAEGDVELYADQGQPTVARQHPYGTCGKPLDGWCSDSIIRALEGAFGRGGDDMRSALTWIVSSVDRAARS